MIKCCDYDIIINHANSFLDAFKKDICDDPKLSKDEEMDWFVLSLGYFIGKGLSYEESYKLSIHLRYHLQYWMV